jgi:hypothetical protein
MRAILSAGLMLTATAAVAEERRLDSGEIETLLKANTVFGETADGRFRHFFGRNGETSLNPPNAAEKIGTWRVDHDKNRLEIRWRRGNDWIPVRVYIDGQTITMAYVNGRTRTGTVMNTRGIE